MIDYSKLNDKIVSQAYAGFKSLTEAEKQKLIKEKLERGIRYQKSLRDSQAI